MSVASLRKGRAVLETALPGRATDDESISIINDGDICWPRAIHAICGKMKTLESLELEAWKEVARHAGEAKRQRNEGDGERVVDGKSADP